MFEVKETKEALIQAISQMAEREKTVLTLYYYEGLTLAEIGDILGVTESRVCQIHTKAVLQLRAKLADRPEGGGRRTARPGAKARPGDGGSPPGGPRRQLSHPGRLSNRPPAEPARMGSRVEAPAGTSMDGPRHPAGRPADITHPTASTVAPRQGCCGRGRPTVTRSSHMAVVTMKQLLGAGVHFGHQTRRWNPKMRRFILGERNGIYLIDLRQTMKGIEESYGYIRDLVAGRRDHPLRRARRSRPRDRWPPTPRPAACPTSTSAGWAGC